MAQALYKHCFSFDLLSLFQDLLVAPEEDIGMLQILQALVLPLVVVRHRQIKPLLSLHC